MSDINTTGTVSISQDYTNNYRNQMQESLIDAINILYKGAVAKENISKTLECIISDASERDKGIYKVDYMKNIFEVSCPLSTLYDVGDAVFVLVPDGDFSKTKIIVGSAEGNTGGSSGTDVEANPAGTATDILEKLRVGTTIYSVEGGSTDVVTDVKVNGASVVGSDHVARISAVTQAQLENALETKADATDLTDLEETVNDLITTVSGKANQSSLEALTTIVRTKANSADVNAALNLKANQSDLNDLATIVDSKANQSEITAIKDGAIIDSFGDVENALTSKQDTLAFDNVPTQNSNNPVTSGGIYSALINKVNSDDIGTAAAKDYVGSVTENSTDLVTSGAVYAAIDNLPEPMVFKGSLGTGGTVTALPVDGSATIGDTYKVITAGTYASQTAKVGDTFICDSKTSSANTWVLIPSGDEPSGTVTSITLKATSPIAIDSSLAITTSGTRTLSHANSGATAGSYGDSGNQTPGYGSTFKVPYVTVNATGHVTDISEHTVKIPASDNTNTTYTFANGTNQFIVTPSGGSAQTVKVTPNDTTKLPLAGGNMTGNIGYTGSKSTSSMIKFMNNTADAYGNGIYIGGGGATIIGGGESSDVMAGQVNAGDEILYLGNDSDVNIFTNLQGGWDSRKTFTFSANGNVTFAGSFTANSIDATKLSGTIPSGCYTDTKYTAATAAPGAIAASGSAGTSTNYARQDHTHGIAVATGDANGQVKIAGQNVSVKGLGSAAYANNYAGSSSAGGAANSLANFKVTNNTNLEIDNPGSNAIGYVSGLTKAAWNYQQTDGALYTQRYDDKWITEIFQDYRTGQISVRSKNNGTWQGWRNILDSSNYASYITAYLPLAGGTMTGTLITTPNAVNINFRNHASYYCTASYQTAGNEALVFATKNPVTSFMFVSGEDSVTNHAQDRWRSLTPGLQIKQNCVSINKLIADNVNPTYNLEVNGTQYVSGALTTGSTISATGAISSSGAITADGAITSGGLLTAVTGLYTGGRVYNAGDDEGIIIKQTGNGYAGLILGSHNARRSVFYLNNDKAFWRYNDGSASHDINHPGKSGTIALTSDVTNHTDPIFYGTCSTAAGTAAKVMTASKFSGLAEGVVINVKFTNANTADSPTLNVNNTGAKAIWKSGGNVKSSNPGWMANEVVSFTYDGTRWIMNDVLSSGRLHTQGYNGNCDTTLMTCSVNGRSASLGGLLRITQASQDIFTIGAMSAIVIDTPAQGILINQSTKTIYPITGMDNLFSSASGNIPVGVYTVFCNFRVTYTYQDFA